LKKLEGIINNSTQVKIEIFRGNLLSIDDCVKAAKDISVVYHVAAGIEKTFPGCYMNSVITTRNLLEATRQNPSLKRFVNVSSFAVYSNMRIRRRGKLDETCHTEDHFMERCDAYCYGKAKQDEMVLEYARKYALPFCIIRPGVVYGPNARGAIHSRVGISPFGPFFHLGGGNRLPLTYIDNCADAIVLAGIIKGADGQIFNVVDDNLPTSRKFLRTFKREVKIFRSFFIPFWTFYFFCYLWEKYADWSNGQLPLAFNRRKCSAEWKGNKYPNQKIKSYLGWRPRVTTEEGIRRHCEYFRQIERKDA
jgi:nucleoside-diphosphate-sugar epimerase